MSKKWYKGNLHSHTTNSDGRLTPEEAFHLYKEHGYSFLCFSEHDRFTNLTALCEGEEFLILPGLEASVCLVQGKSDVKTGDYIETTFPKLRELIGQNPGMRMVKTHHIHGILGNKSMQEQAGNKIFTEDEYTPIRVYFNEWDGPKAAQKLSDYLKGRGCFTTYNHPRWSRVDIEDVRGLDGIWAVECYNYNTVNECGEGEDTYFLDDFLRHRIPVNTFASDDNHNNGMFADSCGGYVMVRAEELTHEAIVNALLAGDYYSSNGARIGDIRLENNHIVLDDLVAKRVHLIVGGSVGSSHTISAQGNEPIQYVDYRIPEQATYVRVEIEDFFGRRAWTNPFYFSE